MAVVTKAEHAYTIRLKISKYRCPIDMHALVHQGAGFGSFRAAAAKCPSTVEMLPLAMWYGGLML